MNYYAFFKLWAETEHSTSSPINLIPTEPAGCQADLLVA